MVATMRLDEKTRQEIRQAARRFFEADVYLFGSRADDSRRGGDIDLYIETGLSPEQAVRARQASQPACRRTPRRGIRCARRRA